MTGKARVFVGAAVAVLALDTLGSFASERLGFSYSSLLSASFVIYAAAGFFNMRYGGFRSAAQGGGFAALVDATAGWAISWAVGPGRPPDGYTGLAPILLAAAVVVITGVLFGLAGGLVARLVARRRGTKMSDEKHDWGGLLDPQFRSWGCLLGQLIMGAVILAFAFSRERVRYGPVSALFLGGLILVAVVIRAIANLFDPPSRHGRPPDSPQ